MCLQSYSSAQTEGCSYHGDPVCARTCVCVCLCVCPCLPLADGEVGGQVERLKVSLSPTDWDRDGETLPSLLLPPSSSSSPFFFFFLHLFLLSSPFLYSARTKALPPSPPVSLVPLSSSTTLLAHCFNSWPLLYHLYQHPPQGKTDRKPLDPCLTGSTWQRLSALVSPKSISCMKSWASQYPLSSSSSSSSDHLYLAPILILNTVAHHPHTFCYLPYKVHHFYSCYPQQFFYTFQV